MLRYWYVDIYFELFISIRLIWVIFSSTNRTCNAHTEMEQKNSNNNSSCGSSRHRRSSSHNTTIKRTKVFSKLTTVQHNDQRIESKSEWCPRSVRNSPTKNKNACMHACKEECYTLRWMVLVMRRSRVWERNKKTTNNNVGVESIRKIVLSIYFSQRLKTLLQHSREQNEKIRRRRWWWCWWWRE